MKYYYIILCGFVCISIVFLSDHPERGVWSGGRDLNLRQSGFCTLDRLNDAHHTGRRLQRLRQPRPKLGWLGSSTKLSYRPTEFYNVKITIYGFRCNSSNYDGFCYVYHNLLQILGFWLGIHIYLVCFFKKGIKSLGPRYGIYLLSSWMCSSTAASSFFRFSA